MKRFLKYYIVIIIFICLASVTYAINIIDPNTGSTTTNNNLSDASWNPWYVGLKVSIVGSDKTTIKDVKIFLNSYGTYKSGYGGNGCYFSKTKSPKLKGETEIKWEKCENVFSSSIKVDFLPNTWEAANNNIDEILKTECDSNGECTHENLKDLFKYLNVGSGDYIVVEPMAKIGLFYGTAYELANSGFLGETGLKKADGSSVGNTYWGAVFGGASYRPSGGIFRNTIYLSKPFLGMSAPNCGNTDYVCKNYAFKKPENGTGVGVYTYDSFEEKSKSLLIQKYKVGTSDPIRFKSAQFEIYKGENCEGDVVKSGIVTVSGEASEDLEPGVYSLKETKVPDKYKPLTEGEECVVSSFTIKEGEVTVLPVENTPTCEAELDELYDKYEISRDELLPSFELYDLYSKYSTYNYNKLFNFSSPSCGTKSCPSSSVSGCLTVNETSTGGITTDYSCTKPTSSYSYARYKDYFSVENKLETNLFKAKAGQFLLRKGSNGIIVNGSETDSFNIATATVKRVYSYSCYSGCGTYYCNPPTPTNPGSITITFNNKSIEKKSSSYPLYDNFSSSSSTYCYSVGSGDDKCTMCVTNYEDTYTYKYDFPLENEVHIEKLTGKTYLPEVSKDNTKLYISTIGVISRFEERDLYNNVVTKGYIPFSIITHTGTTIEPADDSKKCKYEVTNEIVKDGELNIEFRSIDTTNPFNRNTGSNWCATTGSNQCKRNNDTVSEYINNKPNSYGLDKDGNRVEPKYTITLTPEDIRIIRAYNEDHKYDNYILVSGENSFVSDLKLGTLNRYNPENGSILSIYGTLSSNLE